MLGMGDFLLLLLFCTQAMARRTEVAARQRGAVLCCDQSVNSRCRYYCRNLLEDTPPPEDQRKVLNKLVMNGCGSPLPSERLWQCFLRVSYLQRLNHQSDHRPRDSHVTTGHQPEQGRSLLSTMETHPEMWALPLDLAKAHCCSRAQTTECGLLCLKTYGREWTTAWTEFDRLCQYNAKEQLLIQCLEQVAEPCQIGCNGLQYCKSFNGRPLELFGGCTSKQDAAARDDAALMMKPQGEREHFLLPDPISRFLKTNATLNCPKHLWTAVACILQIKPCHVENHYNKICRSDCLGMLSSCVEGGVDKEICGALSAPQGEPCISLQEFLSREQDDDELGVMELHHPCRSQPCPTGFICRVMGVGYLCSPGCSLGEMSVNLVPLDTWVLVPQPGGCQRPCLCSESDLSLTHCNDNTCRALASCYEHNGENNTRRYAHGSYFSADCNSCLCFDGQVTCWQRLCEENTSVQSDISCNCPYHYVPVCSVNGKTYPSPCHARCAKLQEDQYQSGPCHTIDPCSSNPCSPNKRCIPERRVCLIWENNSCPQYRCVPLKDCMDVPYIVVCDMNGQQHDNLCRMLKINKTLSYFGGCQNGCSSSGTICGINGEEYESECAAWADYTLKDYDGTCRAYPVSDTKKCAHVKCTVSAMKNCIQIQLPGTCCPICGGGVLSLAFSERILSHYISITSDSASDFSVRTLASQLAQSITLAECRLAAHLNFERTRIVVAVVASIPNPTMLQVSACAMEAVKLRTLVDQQSPVLFLQLPLAAVVGVDLQTISRDSTCGLKESGLLVVVALVMLNELSSW